MSFRGPFEAGNLLASQTFMLAFERCICWQHLCLLDSDDFTLLLGDGAGVGKGRTVAGKFSYRFCVGLISTADVSFDCSSKWLTHWP